jgi:hypothetical protein
MARNHSESLLLQDIVRLRNCGQYFAALKLLDNEGQLCLEPSQLYLEKALCYVFQHNFGALLQTLQAWTRAPGSITSKERALIVLLYDFARFHTDLALLEALASSNTVVAQWLTEKSTRDFDESDVCIACIDHIIQDRARRFLSAEDDDITEDFPSCERMETLLDVLLQNERFIEVGLLHLAESITRSAQVQIRHLEKSLERIQASSMPEGDKYKLQHYLRVLLSQAYFESGNALVGCSYLLEQSGGFVSDEIEESLLWSRYLTLRHKSRWEDGDIADIQRLSLDFKSLHNMMGWQSSSFLLAEVFRDQGSRGFYSDLILSQFKAR